MPNISTFTKKCSRCKLEKNLSEFGRRNGTNRAFKSWCRDCCNEVAYIKRTSNPTAHSEAVKRYWLRSRERNRIYVKKYLLTHPCVDCGEPDPNVLDFDHREGVVKVKGVSSMTNGNSCSFERLQREIDKCDIRCANCHRRKTRKERGWFNWDDIPID